MAKTDRLVFDDSKASLLTIHYDCHDFSTRRQINVKPCGSSLIIILRSG